MLHKQRFLTCEITRQYRQRKTQRWQKKPQTNKRTKKKQPPSSTLKTTSQPNVYISLWSTHIFKSTLNKLDYIPCIQITIIWELGAKTEDVQVVTYCRYVYRVIFVYFDLFLFYTYFIYIYIFTEIPVSRMKDRMYTRQKLHKRYTEQTLHHDRKKQKQQQQNKQVLFFIFFLSWDSRVMRKEMSLFRLSQARCRGTEAFH